MARETEIAKKFLAEGNKQRALLCLKKKKLQEQMLEKSDAQLRNIEEMVRKKEERRKKKEEREERSSQAKVLNYSCALD